MHESWPTNKYSLPSARKFLEAFITSTHHFLIPAIYVITSRRTMTSQPQSGIACKTCRRRGRKCDRTLPKCKSCQGRDVECEGYPLRWVGLAARGRIALRTYDNLISREQQVSISYESNVGDGRLANCVSSSDVTLRQSPWELPATLLPLDYLRGFIKYCKTGSLRGGIV